LGPAALILLAACTSAIGTEPSVGNIGGSLAIIADGESVNLPEPDTNEGSAKQQAEDSSSSNADEPATGALNEQATPDLITDTTTQTDVEILVEDNRSNSLRNLTAGWQTNWNRRTVEFNEILSGGPPRDGIPSIDNPQFITPSEASAWLEGNEPVIALEINGDARAYPLQILTWHEITNDIVGGVPAVITFCPLCNSALVFDRRVDGEVFEFGVSGLLRNSDLIMYDRTSETLWQQFTGDAIIGDLAGRRLKFLPSSLVSFDDFRAAHPDGLVLSRETGFPRRQSLYGLNPYTGYDAVGQNPFLFRGPTDGRLPAMERVVTIALDEVDVAYPLSILSEIGVINDRQGEQDLVVFHTNGTSSALEAEIIADGADVGATGAFDPNLDRQKLTFRVEGENIIDEETGSTWNILGQATAGPLVGKELTPIVHGDHFWFSWAAFRPDTIIYQRRSALAVM
jgi:hypothetical protein